MQKHITGNGRVIRIPAAADVYGSEAAAIIEHVAHIRNASGVPTGKVKRRQRRKIVKSIPHIGDAGDIPTGKVTITSYLNANSAVFPSFVFVTVKLYDAVVIPRSQSIVRLSEELPLKSIIRTETCALSPPLDEERFLAKETPLAASRRVTKRITSAKTDLAPSPLFVPPFLNIFVLRQRFGVPGITRWNFRLIR